MTICLGTMHFGTLTDEATAFALLDRFTERGGTLVDTANCYATWAGTGDESEEVIGRWHTSRGARDRIALATKVGARPDGSGAPWPLDAEGLPPRPACTGCAPTVSTSFMDTCRIPPPRSRNRWPPSASSCGTGSRSGSA
jgi:aryl-alcohol dehydrogenase-like predicted oxidoreductase